MSESLGTAAGYRRIATEEAFITPEPHKMYRDRVMYAMDYPYQYVIDEVRARDSLPISDADKKNFYQTTAEKAFRL